MNINIKELEKIIAKNKVYDAWQYVQSLLETLNYMTVSYELLKKVHEHRVNTLQAVNQEILQEAFTKGKAKVTTSDLMRTNLDVGGYELDDSIFLKKTAMEFFHYGRISMDVLFQITNPLLIKPNDEIYSFDFRFDKIFIRKKGSDEEAIVGVATLKNGINSNEFYRVYEVSACQQIDYGLYIANFKNTYKSQKLNMNIYAMDGTMIFIKD